MLHCVSVVLSSRITVDSLSLAREREGFGGLPRCYWSRLETRAKEHSVKPSHGVSNEAQWR